MWRSILSKSRRAVRREGESESESEGTSAEEFVGGYYLVDVTSIERAVELAARFVEARFAPVEVRRLGA